MGQDWPILAAYVRRARIKLGYDTVTAWARALESEGSTLKIKTLRRIESGERVGPNVLAALELALGWPLGAAELILAGHDPFEEPAEATIEAPATATSEHRPPARTRGVFDLTNEQILDVADYAEQQVSRAFSRELLRWALDMQRAADHEEDETEHEGHRDAG